MMSVAEVVEKTSECPYTLIRSNRKHGILSEWEEYWNCYNQFKNEVPGKEKGRLAMSCISYYRILSRYNFFIAYPRHEDLFGESMSFIERYMYPVIEAMEQTAITFFSLLYARKEPNSEENPTITFDAKQRGSQSGIVVNVKQQQDLTTYYMKTYYNDGTLSASGRFCPDLREIFVYKLLELIKHHYTKYVLYIATKKVEGLGLTMILREEELHKNIIVQAYLLSNLLSLYDLNIENFGIDKDDHLAIIDFLIRDQCDNVLDNFKLVNFFGHPATNPIASRVLEQISSEERMKIAKQSILDWQLLEKIKEADEEITPTKNLLEKEEIDFQNNTEKLNKYIAHIKDNIALFDN
ncbi:hypothetical protein FO519_009466 [Halicephalobus sp. NKZ332]|nr:hypothetical protein FO519_009466 [Halicephalobus sp. NKZ332]